MVDHAAAHAHSLWHWCSHRPLRASQRLRRSTMFARTRLRCLTSDVLCLCRSRTGVELRRMPGYDALVCHVTRVPATKSSSRSSSRLSSSTLNASLRKSLVAASTSAQSSLLMLCALCADFEVRSKASHLCPSALRNFISGRGQCRVPSSFRKSVRHPRR